MLELKVYDGEHEVVLEFEHSLLSVSKWESKHLKPFMSRYTKTSTEMIEYFECMLLTPGVNKNLIYALSPQQLDDLANYINAPQTASSVPSQDSRLAQETVTSELIYYWMVGMKINWEAQNWHLSRLMMLIEITNYKLQPEKKRPMRETMAKWREANERQKKLFNTSG